MAEAGTLASKVGSADKYKITNLKLTGNLNVEDMKFIREMAGCYYDENGSKYDGHLQHLDLADAKFVGDESFDAYYPDPVHEGKFYKETARIEESRVGRFQFAFLHDLKTVVLPKNTTEISYGGLYDCRGLTSVSLPKSQTRIEALTFAGCANLASVSLPEDLTEIGGYAFAYSGLTSLSLPKGVTGIEYLPVGGINLVHT